MNFNFYEKYQEFSTTELLKIVRQTDQYDPQAIAAAHQVLSEREISEAEMSYVDSFFKQENAIAEKKRERQHIVKKFFLSLTEKKNEREDMAKEFFLTFVRPNAGNALLYVNGIVMLAVFKCLHLVYLYYRPGGLLYNCSRCFQTWEAIYFLMPLFLAITICLMIYRSRWGWALLFGYCLAALVTAGLEYISDLIRYKEYPAGSGFYIGTLMYVLFIVIMSRPKVKESFGIAENTKRTVAIIAVVLGALHAMLISLSHT